MKQGTRPNPLTPDEFCTSCGHVTACLHHPDKAGVIVQAAADWVAVKK